jgi:hypothetical protein
MNLATENNEALVTIDGEYRDYRKNNSPEDKINTTNMSSIDNMSRCSFLFGHEDPFIEIERLPNELKKLGEALNS